MVALDDLTIEERAAARELIALRTNELLDEAADQLADVACLEAIVGALVAQWQAPEAPEHVPWLMLDALEARGDGAAVAVLHAAALLATEPFAAAARGALGRLARGRLPAAPSALAALDVRGAERVTLGTADLYLVRMRRGNAGPWQVAVAVVEREATGGALVDGLLSGPLDASEARDFRPLSGADLPAASPVPASDLADVLTAAAARSRELGLAVGLELAGALGVLGLATAGDAGALAGLALESAACPLVVDQQDREAFDALSERLLEEFLEAFAGDPAVERSGLEVADAMLEWKFGYEDGHLGCWHEGDVEEFLLGHMPRKVTVTDAMREDAPRCVTAFLRFLHGLELLAGDLDELVGACDAIRDEFAGAAVDRSRWGLAKTMVEQMRAEGVEPTSQAALDAWMADFNARPPGERDAILGPALSALPGPRATAMRRSPRRAGQGRQARRRAVRSARRRNRR